jgi:hypothetical protein
MRSRDRGVAPAGPGLRPFGAEPQDASQAEPLVPNAAHTPLPWGISYGFDLTACKRHPGRATYVCGPNPESIGIKISTPWIEGAWDDDAEAKANAAFIVRACNSHYALIEALQQFVNGVETRMIDSPADETLANITHRARVAIANARGEL